MPIQGQIILALLLSGILLLAYRLGTDTFEDACGVKDGRH